jgi:hypothetical protein
MACVEYGAASGDQEILDFAPQYGYGRFQCKQVAVMNPDHRHTYPRWKNDIVDRLEEVNEGPGERLRQIPPPGVGHELPSARLPRGENYIEAQTLQNRERGAANFRI